MYTSMSNTARVLVRDINGGVLQHREVRSGIFLNIVYKQTLH